MLFVAATSYFFTLLIDGWFLLFVVALKFHRARAAIARSLHMDMHSKTMDKNLLLGYMTFVLVGTNSLLHLSIGLLVRLAA